MNEPCLVGLVAADRVPADLSGEVIPCGAIAAAIRPAQSRGGDSDRLEHHAAVVAWCRRAAFLPSRVGIAISPQLLQSIGQAAWSYRIRLEHIADRVEIAVELERRNNRIRRAGAGGGRAYLRAAAHDLTACEVDITTAARLLAKLAGRIDADLIVCTAPLPSVRLRAAMLVKRACAPRLAQQIETALSLISARLVCQVTGPWPPYSFSAIEEAP
jgi:hypothetical protein